MIQAPIYRSVLWTPGHPTTPCPPCPAAFQAYIAVGTCLVRLLWKIKGACLLYVGIHPEKGKHMKNDALSLRIVYHHGSFLYWHWCLLERFKGKQPSTLVCFELPWGQVGTSSKLATLEKKTSSPQSCWSLFPTKLAIMFIMQHPQYPKHLWDDSISHDFTFHTYLPLCLLTTNNYAAAFASATLVFKAASPRRDIQVDAVLTSRCASQPWF